MLYQFVLLKEINIYYFDNRMIKNCTKCVKCTDSINLIYLCKNKEHDVQIFNKRSIN